MERDQVVEILGLEPHPEGGWFRRTHFDGSSSAIYFLVAAGEPTKLHRVPGAEAFHFYAGAPAHMLLLRPDGSVAEPELGPDLGAGERPQVIVPGGTWQAMETAGEWTLAGTTMAPPFEWERFELGERDELLAGWPSAAEAIVRPA